MTDKAKMTGLLVSAGYSAKEIRAFRNQDFVLSKREVATVLAALRLVQHERDPEYLSGMPHFEDCKPLSRAEIDALCQRINRR